MRLNSFAGLLLLLGLALAALFGANPNIDDTTQPNPQPTLPPGCCTPMD